MKIRLVGEDLELLSQKAIFWKRTQTLLLADAHLGKVAHFRQSGIGIPAGAGHETFLLLHQLIQKKAPQRILFLGDLFHSRYNSDFEKFAGWRSQFPRVEFVLVLGNHEIETRSLYERLGLTLFHRLEEGPFSFTHEPNHSDLFNLAGHLHPCVALAGKAKQSVKVPCFWFGKNFGVLPAFGEFTGNHPVWPLEDEQVYAVAGSKIFDLSVLTSLR